MLKSYININELRAALKDTAHSVETHWIEICGHKYFVHPVSPGGWRRIVHIEDNAPVWIIYYFPNMAVRAVDTARRSADTYFKGSKLYGVDGSPDIFFVDPKLELIFSEDEVRKLEPSSPKRFAYAIPKLDSLVSKLSPKGKEVYDSALLDITEQLANNVKWVYDLETLKYASMYNFFKFDLSELGTGEVLILLRAVREFFKESADEIKVSQANGLYTLIFTIEV